ncbi:MAG: DNA recombination protein RmuC [Syntrophorhabdaceae bacterium]|nr:DNA recombination protein RmuC [Syntrophorhabdaceae bacterium]
MDNYLYVIIAFISGLIAGWLLLRPKVSSQQALAEERLRLLNEKDDEINRLKNELIQEKQTCSDALARLEAAQKNLDDQKQLIESMKKELTDTFNALSSAALKSSSEDFLRLASQNLEKILEVTKGKLGEHQAAMDSMIKPLQDALKRYEEQIILIEGERKRMYGSLEEQLRAITLSHENLQRETINLTIALRKPQVRGRWGEMQLLRVVELSGMSQYCDVSIQTTVDSEKGRLRPDMVVHLPSNREIIVDSKAPLDAYLDAVSATTEEERKSHLARHAQQIRNHIKNLSSKEYWSQFEKSPEFVVLFIPGESFLSTALEADPLLLESAMEKKIIIATPTTFVALLRAIAYGWQQKNMEVHAYKINELAKELYERFSTTLKYFDELGTSLKKATDNYNKTVGSLESRVLPSLRRFKELGVSVSGDLPDTDKITIYPRIKEE